MNKVLSILLLMASLTLTHAQGRYALLVGISDYPQQNPPSRGDWTDIHGANDVKLIVPELQRQGFVIKTLLDQEATHANIIKELKRLKTISPEGAIIYIHFSCHGQPFENKEIDEVGEDGWDESLVPVDAKKIYEKGGYEGENHLIDDELSVYTQEIRKKIGENGILYVVVDACHAGSMLRGGENTRGVSTVFSSKGEQYYSPILMKKKRYEYASGPELSPVYFIEACSNTENNTEVNKNGIWYGPLSFHISKVLCKGNITIGKDPSWINLVDVSMKRDFDVKNQNIVLEIEK